METWTQLSADETHTFYSIPIELAMKDGNSFFGLKHHPLDTDGPWPILAFLQDKNHPDVVTFHASRILPEAQELAGFNPLLETRVGGHISLSRENLVGLVNLLRKYSLQLSVIQQRNEKMFKKIEDSDLFNFHLHPERFASSKRLHYYQVYNPLEQSEKKFTTILIFSTRPIGPQNVPSPLSLKIASFPLKSLQNPSFNPLEDSLPQVHLDRSGMQELSSLLHSQLAHLVG
jgi:hypothetical protein